MILDWDNLEEEMKESFGGESEQIQIDSNIFKNKLRVRVKFTKDEEIDSIPESENTFKVEPVKKETKPKIKFKVKQL